MGRRVLATGVAIEVVLIGILLAWKRLDGLDLDVYRLGARALFDHGDPYGALPPTRNGTFLPFTYPPFAAFVFAPLLVIPPDVALAGITVVSVLALGAVLALCFARHDRRLHVFGGIALIVQAVALFSEPVRATLGFGQVNLLLMLLVTVDALAPVRRGGFLVGLAAAVKLTPAAFVLFFLLRKDFRAAARAVATFAGCALLAWVIAPRASVTYWTKLVFAGDRVGDPGYIGNQSLRGLFARLGAPTWAWAVAVVVTLVVTVLVMRGADRVVALLACALGALLVSPVSWTHHWVWAAPVIGILTWRGRRLRPLVLGTAALATVVFVLSPLWDHRSVWPLAESYVLTGVLLLLALRSVAQPLDDPLDAAGQRRDVARLDRGEHADP
ncbi:glycosyltransferase 87 family protein [Amycolatopsis endophytica]|uniref:Alpha-1,2-mannosyltransferase n=1 Tax=Amycolatopsis endophytica TaxID=860233 RepID=A0A853B362_9PSEU|nr:glycosyltransferase 87 family protein [Amycolatopsis endophytica]NYI89244.1 alpha-1,2-mannosyltransferase [Amycolatopsis endophytica]